MILDTPTYRRLVDVARENERSTSAELRVAIRRHLAEVPAAPRAVDQLVGERGPDGSGGARGVSPIAQGRSGRLVRSPAAAPLEHELTERTCMTTSSTT